jgi:hypothetical protein
MTHEKGRYELVSAGLQTCWQRMNCDYTLHCYMQNGSEHYLVWSLEI